MHRIRLLCVLLACALAPAAAARVVDSSPAGFTIENSRDVPVDADTTWRALVEDVDRWWPKDHSWWGGESTLSIDPVAGGCFCERTADGRRSARHMVVVFAEPGKLLRLDGGLGPLQGMGVQGVMEWRLEPVEGGTRVTLFYRAGGYTPDDLSKFAPIVDRVQAHQLGGLADHLGAPDKED